MDKPKRDSRGGLRNPPGGRPPKPETKYKAISVKLPPDILEWLNANAGNRNGFIVEAIRQKKESDEELHALVTELSQKIGETTIDLRYTNGKWGVMVPLGNMMVVVRGSLRASPAEAVQFCLEKWEQRSPDHNFIYDHYPESFWQPCPECEGEEGTFTSPDHWEDCPMCQGDGGWWVYMGKDQ